MGLGNMMQKAMNAMKLSDDEYEDDEFDIEDFDDEEAAEEKPAKVKNKKSKKEKKAAAVEESYDTEDLSKNIFDDEPAYSSKSSSRDKIVPVKRSAKTMEVTVMKPTVFDNASEITECLVDGVAVIINLEGIDDYLAQRIIDYTAGTCYAIQGNLKQISKYIIIVAPKNVEITGDIEDMATDTSNLTSGSNYSFNY